MIERDALPSYREWIVEVVPAGRPELELENGPALPDEVVES
jgi:hypothetical protein